MDMERYVTVLNRIASTKDVIRKHITIKSDVIDSLEKDRNKKSFKYLTLKQKIRDECKDKDFIKKYGAVPSNVPSDQRWRMILRDG